MGRPSGGTRRGLRPCLMPRHCLPSGHLWLQLEELGPGALPGPLVSTLALNPRPHCIRPPTLAVTASPCRSHNGPHPNSVSTPEWARVEPHPDHGGPCVARESGTSERPAF